MIRRTRSVRLVRTTVAVEWRDDGSLRLRAPQALPAYPRSMIERLEHWARETPERVFLAQRGADGAWRTLTYAAASERSRRVAAALLGRGLSVERPLAVLSGNDIEHAI